jgi:hypothetical protein
VTDWSQLEKHLDDRSVAHSCAFCGQRIPAGDADRWSLAVRRLGGHTSVVWVHGPCFIGQLHPSVKRAYLPGGPGAPPEPTS